MTVLLRKTLRFPRRKLTQVVSTFREKWGTSHLSPVCAAGESPTEVTALRQYTHMGRPFGSAEFVRRLEHSTLRLLTPGRAGLPKKPLPISSNTGPSSPHREEKWGTSPVSRFSRGF